jgi:hypothetical protein
LESLFRVVMIKEAAADAPDHHAVPLDQGREGGLIAVFDEAAQQLAVGQAGPFGQNGLTKVLHHLARRARHRVPPSAGFIILYQLSAARPSFDTGLSAGAPEVNSSGSAGLAQAYSSKGAGPSKRGQRLLAPRD